MEGVVVEFPPGVFREGEMAKEFVSALFDDIDVFLYGFDFWVCVVPVVFDFLWRVILEPGHFVDCEIAVGFEVLSPFA